MKALKHDKLFTASTYTRFDSINGLHPLKKAVPEGFVDYAARIRPNGQVFYFNFDLARDMGLIPAEHPNELSNELKKAILRTFSLQIINEWDIEHGITYPSKDMKPHAYMATRYLQIQHPNKQGKTSGDGRSIWNGYFKGRNAWWDVSSCGTGATCLSPATAIEGRFFKTGAKDVSYGTGLADLDGGISSALMSDIFHRNGIATERNLCVIAYPDRSAVIVRAGKNLLRPAHLFLWLKQNRHHELKAAVDYYIERQVKNKEFPNFEHAHQAYDHLTQFICEKFAKAAAFFEMEYIFCWMDWDGDNILSDAGIIDYGSVRQFGLFHSEYRYDDVDKYSTSINEQRKHARYTVQTYLQIVEFIKTGHKSNIKLFNHHETLVKFDQIFEQHKDYMLLYKMGFEPKLIEYFLADDIRVEWAREFRQVYRYFEKAKAKRGKYRINDGITWDAIFCLRDMLRELPKRYLNGEHMLSHKDFIEILLSDYASNRDIAHYRKRKEKTRQFQTLYWQIVSIAADLLNKEEKAVLIAMSKRSELINRHDRITGDGLIHATERLMRSQKNLSNKELHNLFLDFVEQQVLVPEYFKKVDPHQHVRSTAAKKVLQGMLKVVKSHREGI